MFLHSKDRKNIQEGRITQFNAIIQFSNHSWYNFEPICKFYCKFSIHIIVLRNGHCEIKTFLSFYTIHKTFIDFLSMGKSM